MDTKTYLMHTFPHGILTSASSAAIDPNLSCATSSCCPSYPCPFSEPRNTSLRFLSGIFVAIPTMSGYLPSDAEAALWGEGEQARRAYYQNQSQNPRLGGQTPRSSYQPQWATTAGIPSAQAQIQHHSYAAPAQYASWPSSNWQSLRPTDYGRGQYSSPTGTNPASTITPILPSSPYSTGQQWSNAPWPALHPDDIEASSDTSRSVSPSPADLHNFGIPLPDGRSWRCGYPQCTSQAVFTRGCDLRKHFRRHTKTLFCRHEGCSQSKEGGFSSKKDRDRHESRHAPQIKCTHQGCDRVFSRVDNMKDHVRRIHRKNA